MTTQNLLEGLKKLLETEYKKAAIKLYSKEGGKVMLPNVYIGFLPMDTNVNDYPAVIIVPPTEAIENDEGQMLPITFALGVVHADISEWRNGWFDILTLIERTKEILKRNRVVADAFCLTGDIKWGVDSAEYSQTISLGEITVNYETGASYTEAI